MSAILPLEVAASDHHWFDEANNKVTSQIDGLGDDPPFFLDNVEIRTGSEHGDTLATEDPILSYMRSSGWETENEELRGVIDDLTLDIKRLKRKLRWYREADPRHLRHSKLFEVRTYRLSARRKRRLESMLQRFVDDVSVPPRLSKDGSPSDTESLLPERDSEEMLAMLIKCLCSPNISHHASAVRSKFLHSTRDGWFNVDEVLHCIQAAASAITQHDFSPEALKRHRSCIVVSGDGTRLRSEMATQGTAEVGPTNPTDIDKQTSSRFPLGTERLMMTTNKNAYYNPSALLQHTRENELERLSITASDADSVQQVTVVEPNLHVFQSHHLPSMAHSGKTVYYKNAPFFLDQSCDDPELPQPCQSPPQYDQENQNRRRPSRDHVSNRFAAYQDVNSEDCMMHHELSCPSLSLNEEPVSVSVAVDGAKSQPIEFEASGVGNVTPDDNFAVHVTVRHTSDPGPHHGQSHAVTQPPENRLSRHQFSTRPEVPSALNAHIVASTWEKLAPSPLPPPIYGFFSSGSSDNEDGESSPSDPNYGGGYGVDKPTHATSIQEWRAAVFSSLSDGTGSAAGKSENEDAEVGS